MSLISADSSKNVQKKGILQTNILNRVTKTQIYYPTAQTNKFHYEILFNSIKNSLFLRQSDEFWYHQLSEFRNK